MVIQLVSAGNEHLRNDILIDIAYICIQFVAQKFLIDDVFGESIIPKGQSNKQARVTTVQLELVTVDMRCQSRTWIVGMVSVAVIESFRMAICSLKRSIFPPTITLLT